MDEYTTKCINYLIHHDTNLLKKYLKKCVTYDIDHINLNDLNEVTELIINSYKEDEKNEEEVKSNKSSLFICPRCNKNDVLFREYQIRSADEGATLFLNCNSCGYSWKK